MQVTGRYSTQGSIRPSSWLGTSNRPSGRACVPRHVGRLGPARQDNRACCAEHNCTGPSRARAVPCRAVRMANDTCIPLPSLSLICCLDSCCSTSSILFFSRSVQWATAPPRPWPRRSARVALQGPTWGWLATRAKVCPGSGG